MAGEGEEVALYVVLIDGSCDKHVDFSLAQIGHGTLQSCEGCRSGLLGGFAGHDVGLLADDVDDIACILAGLRSIGNLHQLCALQIHRLAVESRYLGAAVDYWGAKLEYAVVIEGFEYHLIADAVEVAVGDAHF